MPLVEDGDPLPRAVVAEADLVALPLHTNDHVPDPAPAVEPAVEKLELGVARFKRREYKSRAQQTAPLVKHRLVAPRRAAASRSRRRGGHALPSGSLAGMTMAKAR